MAIRLSNLSRARRECTVTVTVDEASGESAELPVVYNPRAFTPDLEAQAIKVEESKRGQLSFLAEAVSTLLVDWDLVDDDGNKLGTDVPTLMTMKAAVLGEVFAGIQKDMAPNPKTGEDSAGS